MAGPSGNGPCHDPTVLRCLQSDGRPDRRSGRAPRIEVLVRGYRTFNETIERTFRARVLPILQQTTRIQASQLGTDAPAVGGIEASFSTGSCNKP